MAGQGKKIAKFDSFAACERAERDYYRSLSSQDRLDLLLSMINRYRESLGEAGKGYTRVHRIIELPER